MSVLFIGGVFAGENEAEIVENSKGYAEFSANIFQKKLIGGFKQNGVHIDVVSAPLIGAYPNRYKKLFFSGFLNEQDEYTYVKFNNLWGYRNFSRAAALKRQIEKLIKVQKKNYDLIIAYSAHQPFLEAASFAKKLLPKAKICFVVPDLPQYMNLDANRSKIYDILKVVDIKRMQREIKNVDSFVILTEQMKDMLEIGDRPYFVAEGIIDKLPQKEIMASKSDIKSVVYTGKMNKAFGITELVDAFCEIEGENYRLILCGAGDAVDYVLAKAKEDSRIEYLGQVLPEKAKEVIENASVLVNPRPNNEEYTKYSFPSKNIEYLQSGKPVVAYMLDGMKPIYRDFMFAANEDGVGAAIMRALNTSEEELTRKVFKAREHLQSLMAKSVAKQIIEKTFSIR